MDLIDVHSHILPGLDDGADDWQQSLAMAEAACQDGISLLVATPHVIKGVFDNRKEDIFKQVANLNNYLKHSKVKLTVLAGAEYYMVPDLPSRLAGGELLTLNNSGRYLLLELPSKMVPDYTTRVLRDIQLQGVTPIIAHPERNLGLARKPELLKEWSKRGILAQVTAASITGLFGRDVKKRALNFLQTGAAQMIASDGHDAKQRAPVLYPAFQEIERRWGMESAYTLTCQNPGLIIKGLPLKTAAVQLNDILWTVRLRRLNQARSDIFRI